MPATPAVSICIPFYQGAAFARETLEAVFAQTWTDWELVITDDASVDGTAEVVQQLIAQHPTARIRFERNSERLGMVGNWNKVISLADGNFVKLVCGDDVLVPDCLEKEMRAFQANPGVAVVASSRLVVSSRGRSLFVRRSFKKTGVYAGREVIRQCLLSGTNNVGDPVAVTFRRDLLAKTSLFRASIVYCTDIDLWLRLLMHGDLFYSAEPMARYRIHKGSTGKKLKNEVVKDFLRVVDLISSEAGMKFTPFQLRMIALRSKLNSIARQLVYDVLGDA